MYAFKYASKNEIASRLHESFTEFFDPTFSESLTRKQEKYQDYNCSIVCEIYSCLFIFTLKYFLSHWQLLTNQRFQLYFHFLFLKFTQVGNKRDLKREIFKKPRMVSKFRKIQAFTFFKLSWCSKINIEIMNGENHVTE